VANILGDWLAHSKQIDRHDAMQTVDHTHTYTVSTATFQARLG